MEEITLRQRFEAMNTGETIVVTATRPAIFVNAKRARIAVSTKAVDGHIEVTKTGDVSAPRVIPKRAKQKTLLEQLQGVTASQRLKLFEHFELCCGMNIGQCICPDEVVEAMPVKAVESPVIVPSGMNDAMARFLAKVDSRPIVEEVEEVWELTSDRATLNEDGRWYRYQYLVTNPKRRRLVIVDEEDHNEVVKIVGQ